MEQKYLLINNINVSEDDVKKLIDENKRYQEKERYDRIFNAIEKLDNKVVNSINELKTELNSKIDSVKKDVEGVKQTVNKQSDKLDKLTEKVYDNRWWTIKTVGSIVLIAGSIILGIVEYRYPNINNIGKEIAKVIKETR